MTTQNQQLKPTQNYRVQANNIILCKNFTEDRLRDIIVKALEEADIGGQKMAFAKEVSIYPPQPKKK